MTFGMRYALGYDTDIITVNALRNCIQAISMYKFNMF